MVFDTPHNQIKTEVLWNNSARRICTIIFTKTCHFATITCHELSEYLFIIFAIMDLGILVHLFSFGVEILRSKKIKTTHRPRRTNWHQQELGL